VDELQVRHPFARSGMKARRHAESHARWNNRSADATFD